MIDIPLNKALVPVEVKKVNNCMGCFFYFLEKEEGIECDARFNCYLNNRKDGKNVIFKLVDYKGEGNADSRSASTAT